MRNIYFVVRGFTLIEVLVVMVLIGLMASVVGPAVGAGIESFRLQAACSEIGAGFREAQSSAHEEQKVLVASYSKHEFVFSKENRVIRTIDMPSSVEAGQLDSPVYIFLPTGQVLGPANLDFSIPNGKHFILSLGPTPFDFSFRRPSQ